MMAAKPIPMGRMGDLVRHNIKILMVAREMDLEALSVALTKIGRPIGISALSKIRLGTRRVDVDDLAAIAEALDVEPWLLLRRLMIGNTITVI